VITYRAAAPWRRLAFLLFVVALTGCPGPQYAPYDNRGEIVHKDQSYPGKHEAIIDPGLWDTVQTRLAENKT
jgi:hypothetical protein